MTMKYESYIYYTKDIKKLRNTQNSDICDPHFLKLGTKTIQSKFTLKPY